jgi:hypothetical protein
MRDASRFTLAGFVGGLMLAIMLLPLAQGCGFRAGLARAHKGLKIMSAEVEPRLAAECMRRATDCRDRGIRVPADCEELEECRRWKTAYALGVGQVHRGLELCNAVYAKMQKEGVAR